MPHFPRTTPGVPREFVQPPRDNPPPVPPPQNPSAQRASPGRRPGTLRVSLDRISPHSFTMEPQKVLKVMLGKEPNVDDNTGQLVCDRPPNPGLPP